MLTPVAVGRLELSLTRSDGLELLVAAAFAFNLGLAVFLLVRSTGAAARLGATTVAGAAAGAGLEERHI